MKKRVSRCGLAFCWRNLQIDLSWQQLESHILGRPVRLQVTDLQARQRASDYDSGHCCDELKEGMAQREDMIAERVLQRPLMPWQRC